MERSEQGRVAIVTGASSGIGLAVARAWARRGGRVALVARTARTLEAVAREIGEAAKTFPLDVQDLAALEALPARVKDAFGRLDVVVNNAGMNRRGSIAKYSPRELTDVVTTNLAAPIVLTRAAMPLLERGGSVIQVASIAGMVPVPGEATYSATKAGLRAFARAVADDFAHLDVHVGCVCPGPVDTGFLGDLSEVADVVLSQPMVSAEEVAAAILTCIDERQGEIAIPARSGRLATMAYLVPSFGQRLRPVLEKRGAKNRQSILARKRGSS
jgi:short-subunit dehydrogenase